jgi:ParB family transcriptional regulator, chromosome partitioning protein
VKRGLPDSIRMKHDLHYVDELLEEKSGVVGRFIPIELIRPNPDQPRREFDDLTELVASIREKGVLEPLIVRRFEDGYQIVAGERRWRASKEVGLSVIPCIEKNVDDREMLEIALIENLQRKDLTPFEEADGLQALADKFKYTHAQIAQVIGKSRTSVTETLALNQIPKEVRDVCRRADISSKSLLLQIVRQPNIEAMKDLALRIEKENLSRSDVRKEKQQTSSTKAEPFMYKFKGENFKVMVRFNKSKASRDEVMLALEAALERLKH